MLRTTNIWPTIVEWKNKHHAIPFFFAGYKLNLHTSEAQELGLVEWVRLPQCGEPKFKSWLGEVPYLVADTPQIWETKKKKKLHYESKQKMVF